MNNTGFLVFSLKEGIVDIFLSSMGHLLFRTKQLMAWNVCFPELNNGRPTFYDCINHHLIRQKTSRFTSLLCQMDNIILFYRV